MAIYILQEYAQAEQAIKRSRFIAELYVLDSPETVRTLLKAQKATHAGAAHVVHAFAFGNDEKSRMFACSDDGEPSGTAGRPVLAVLKGSAVSNALLTVTRYFGGILLGTGGLVKAYGDAAKAVLAVAHTECYIPKSTFSCTVPYHLYDSIQKLCESSHAYIHESSFTTDIFLRFAIAQSESTAFAYQFQNLTNGIPLILETE